MTARKKQHRINLALQGGGSHGAYTWGVLDRLLEEEDIDYAGISGTSAGAMNGAIMIDGYIKGGHAGARQALETFWREVSAFGGGNPFQQNLFERMFGSFNLDAGLGYSPMDVMSRMFSPYQFNPLNVNPLRWILEQTIDFKTVQSCDHTPLFVTATEVETGHARVFSGSEITVDALLASACLPFLFQAVEIDGKAYWDGGYMGNPALWPLIYHTDSSDVLLVQINPMERKGVPDTASEIVNRLNEITFNSTLISELRAIDFVSRLIHDNKLDERRYKDVRMHMIESHKELNKYNASSKMNPSWEFFLLLRDVGRKQASLWLKHNKDSLGRKKTMDIQGMFLSAPAARKRLTHMKKEG